MQDVKHFEHGNPFESSGRPTVHSPDSERDANGDGKATNVLKDPPRFSFHTTSQTDAMMLTFQQTTMAEKHQAHRWTWWQIFSGQKDAAEGAKGRGWKAAPFVFAGEFGERAASFGLQMTIINYFLSEMHMPLASASNLATSFFGAAMLSTFGGAFLADAYLGRFLTFVLGAVSYILGLVVFTMAASMKGLLPQRCTPLQLIGLQLPKCQQANTLQMSVLYISLVLRCVGTGAMSPCSAPFGADQFDRSSKKHADQLRHYFNWYYMSVVVAIMIALTVFVYIFNDVGWGWGGGTAAAVMALSLVIFLLGSRYYIYMPTYGSPLTKMLQVVVAAVRKRKFSLPVDPAFLYQGEKFLDKESLGVDHEVLIHTDQFRFLDKAAIWEEVDEEQDAKIRFHPWRLATVNQVEELKQILTMLPIWISSIVVSVVLVQSGTLLVQQAMTMNRKWMTFTIPAASLAVFGTIAMVGFIPFYDLVVIGILRKFTGNPKGLTYLQRIGIGTFLNIVVIVTLAAVEVKRRKVAQQHPPPTGPIAMQEPVLPISAFWLAIPLFLSGITESFLIIGQMEFFYDEAPKSMRSMSSAFVFAALGLGGFLSTTLVSITQSVTSTKGSRTGESGWLRNDINSGHVDYFYWVLAVLSTVNFLYFLLVAHWYKYKKTNLNVSS